MRHKGGAVKKNYRTVQFDQLHKGIPAKIEFIEYDPYRTAFIALVLYKNGARTYVLAPEGVKAGDTIVCDDATSLQAGNRLKLVNIPSGTQVHNVELKPGQGGKLARSAGSYLTMVGLEGNYAYLKMPSSEVRKVSKECFASVGAVSNIEHNLICVGKAGRNRHKGIRPTVRGSAMNACDHPYGGGKGRHSRGTKRPKDK
jgi:large subunit ribosomal protein L2